MAIIEILSRRIGVFLACLSLLAVVMLLLNLNVGWVQPETFRWRPIILKQPLFSKNSFLLAWDWSVMENAPRLTRPISNLFEIIDTHFRVFMANHLFPHPSISLTWMFTLLFSPLLLLGMLKHLGCRTFYRWLFLALYFQQSGILSLITMSFRPGKALACLFLSALLYASVRFRTEPQTEMAPTLTSQALHALIMASILILSLFSDEIGVFGFFILLVITIGQFKYRKAFLASLLIAGIVYASSVFWLLPWVAGKTGHSVIDIYEFQSRFLNLVLFKERPEKYLLLFVHFWTNLKIAFGELTGVASAYDTVHPFFLGASLFVILGFIYLIVTVLRSRAVGQNGGTVNFSNPILRFGILSLIGILLHTILMEINGGPWGIYWYGVFLCIPWVIFVVLLMQSTRKPWLSAAMTISILLLSLHNYMALNFAYKHYHYYPYHPRDLREVFLKPEIRFRIYRENRNLFDPHHMTIHWLRFSTEVEVMKYAESLGGIPAELRYLFVELEKLQNLITDCVYTDKPGIQAKVSLYMAGHGPTQDTHLAEFSGFTGAWFIHTKDGRKLTYLFIHSKQGPLAINENHSCATISAQRRKIIASAWNTEGKLSGDGKKLLWSNGTYWER